MIVSDWTPDLGHRGDMRSFGGAPGVAIVYNPSIRIFGAPQAAAPIETK
jgi:hypothetical protein